MTFESEMAFDPRLPEVHQACSGAIAKWVDQGRPDSIKFKHGEFSVNVSRLNDKVSIEATTEDTRILSQTFAIHVAQMIAAARELDEPNSTLIRHLRRFQSKNPREAEVDWKHTQTSDEIMRLEEPHGDGITYENQHEDEWVVTYHPRDGSKVESKSVDGLSKSAAITLINELTYVIDTKGSRSAVRTIRDWEMRAGSSPIGDGDIVWLKFRYDHARYLFKFLTEALESDHNPRLKDIAKRENVDLLALNNGITRARHLLKQRVKRGND